MEVDRRTASPDFAAGEAQFFRALRAAFSDIQTQCENEKVSNQRSFERSQLAIQQSIHDLEFKCSDLARRKREIEDAERKAALELQHKRLEETQSQKAHHKLEERRRRKYSALLGGDSATNLRIVLVCWFSMNSKWTRLVCSFRLKLSRLPVFTKITISLLRPTMVNCQILAVIYFRAAKAKKSLEMCPVWEMGNHHLRG